MGETGLAAEAPPKIDALGQFELHPVFGPLGRSVNFTNSNLLMLLLEAIQAGMPWNFRQLMVLISRYARSDPMTNPSW